MVNFILNIELNTLSATPIDYSWSFSDKTTKDTSYITHGYYTYPAKFIPQLAQRLIIENSSEGDIVVDPFMGSGTTIVEAIVNNRVGIGTDISEIAYLLAKVKSTPIDNSLLTDEYCRFERELPYRLNGQFAYFLKEAQARAPQNERINYWFKQEQKDRLSVIFARILEIENIDVQDFFMVVFAQILKSCSIWLQKSVKPTRDLHKKDYNPLDLFLQQSRRTIKKHVEFDNILGRSVRENIEKYRDVRCDDARALPFKSGSADLIVTSPPYVTSYEYADLHQLPSLWMGYLDELVKFRQKFIGSAYKECKEIGLKSNLAEEIVAKLKNKKQTEVRSYFADMLETFEETKRVLKRGGRACIVVGNTEFKGVKILNAEVFKEQMENIGFKTHDIIKREIPSKMLPSTRNPQTGRFGKATDSDIKMAYPVEYILIMEKR